MNHPVCKKITLVVAIKITIYISIAAGLKARIFTQNGLHSPHMFFCKLCIVFHRSVFTEHFWATASDF